MTLDGKRTEEAGGPPEYVKTLPHILRKRPLFVLRDSFHEGDSVLKIFLDLDFSRRHPTVENIGMREKYSCNQAFCFGVRSVGR
jgi:hypothetical protein